MQTTDDFRFYTTSTKFSQPFSLKNSPSLVVQFSVKHEQSWIECGGGYVKIFPTSFKQSEFTSESQEA